MKYVRVLLVVLAAIVFVAPATQAQGGGGGRGRGGAMPALMANVTLTEAQQAQVDSVVAHYRTLRQEAGIGGRGAGMDSTMMAKMREMNDKQYDDIRKVLTEDQQKVFDENRKNLPQGRRGGGTGR
jgi:Spy/CpxP family protein refolding chaperone